MRKHLPLAAAIALLGLAAPSFASSQAPPQAAAEASPVEELYEGFGSFLQGITLEREAALAALASLDRDVASVVADKIFGDYAQAAGRAREEVVGALFPTKDGKPTLSTLPPVEMGKAAKRFEERWSEATDAAITALARAGSSDDASVNELRADLYRRLLATSHPISQEPMRIDSVATSDALSLWREALDRDPLLSPTRTWMATHPLFVAGLERFRREGERLGRERFKGIAEDAMIYAVPDRERIPPDLRADRNRRKAFRRAWESENHAMAEAIEQALLSGPSNAANAGETDASGGPTPAARWSTHYLRLARSNAVPLMSTTRAMITLATSLGVSATEAAGMQAALDDSIVQQANLFRRIVRAYDEWQDDATKRGAWLFDSPPPEKLVKAYDELDALEATTKAKIATAIQSPFVRKRAKLAGEQPLPPHVIPMWRALQTGQAQMQGVSWASPPASPAEPPPG